jgi:hypothetical protein
MSRMPTLTKVEATEKIATAVEKAPTDELVEIYAELFPERPSTPAPLAGEIAGHIRHGLLAEEIVDLWNVVFPEDRNGWYDEEDNTIRVFRCDEHINREFRQFLIGTGCTAATIGQAGY